jgi:hypothetical protein
MQLVIIVRPGEIQFSEIYSTIIELPVLTSSPVYWKYEAAVKIIIFTFILSFYPSNGNP